MSLRVLDPIGYNIRIRTQRLNARKPSSSLLYKQKLYKAAKAANLQTKWTSSINQIEESLVKYSAAKSVIRNFIMTKRLSTLDRRNLHAINTLPDGESVSLRPELFSRIAQQIQTSPDRYPLITLMDEEGNEIRSFAWTHAFAESIAEGPTALMIEGVIEGSDVEYTTDIQVANLIKVEYIKPTKNNMNKSKEFFRYLTKQNYLLEQFQVFYNNMPENKSADMPCFLYALREAECPEDIIANISAEMHTAGVSNAFIKTIAERHNIYIVIKTYKEYSDRWDSNISTYGDKTNPRYELGCVASHLFAIKDTAVSQYALNHPELSNHALFPTIRVKNGRVVRGDTSAKTLDSFQVIANLYYRRETMLTPITLANAPKLYNNKFAEVKELTKNSMSSSNFRKIGLNFKRDGQLDEESLIYGKAPFKDEPFEVVYLDYETAPDDNNVHHPYMIAFELHDEIHCIVGPDCTKRFLEFLPPNNNYLLWAHNAGFDARFLLTHFTNFAKSVIESGSRMKQCGGFYYDNRKIVIKDTLSFVNSSLNGMSGMFKDACKDINVVKESFPHHLMHINTYQNNLKLDVIKETFADYDNLIKNASAIDAIEGDELNTIKYAIHYCKQDVKVLSRCFEAFRDMMMKRFKQDVYNHISMPGLAYAIFHNEGCYDDCVEMAGVPLMFVRNAIVGGRVMTRDNEKHHTKHIVSDFDAVSLYPSAMQRMEGFPKGSPKMFKGDLPTCDYYIARVKVESLNKPRHFPLQSIKNEAGSRVFTNDIVDHEVIMDKYALEDLIKFQQAKVSYIEGMIWTEGFNTKICSVIEDVFNERLKLKAEGNPLQNGIKLLMNSSYGKLIQKPIVKTKRFIRGEADVKTYTSKNIEKLICRTRIDDDLYLFEEHKQISNHYSPAHLGVAILSVSKRIMNEVMCLAEDIDSKIWYQDTDSMHIDRDQITKLSDAFRVKYNRELIGKNMGQFHTDFELDGSEGEVFATESIFLGKKSYIDVLACDGNDATGYHIRMKGCPTKLIVDNDYKQTPLEIYKDLYNGVQKQFDLAKTCSINIDTKTQKISNRTSFIRKFNF